MIKNRTPVWAKITSTACLLGALSICLFWLPKTSLFPGSNYGPILHEETSEYSKIRVRGDESKRNLLFVSKTGSEQLQSSIDLDHPHQLQVAYTRSLFASLLIKHPQKRILIVGLGGGGMVRFAEKHLPETIVEAVEIDPVVVRLADEYFETRNSEKVIIHTADAFDFLADSSNGPYDAIYMDAFLRPSVDKDANSKTGRLKTTNFLATIKQRLSPDGILACNLITNRPTTPTDISALNEVFGSVYEMKVAGTGNLAVFGCQTKGNPTSKYSDLAKKLEQEISSMIPFSQFAKILAEK